MSKCWYCNEELTTANYCDEHIGICTKCYASMFQVSNEFVKGLMDKIAELNAKLAESEKNVEFYQERYSDATTSAYGADLIAKNVQSRLEEEIRELKQQLAEKEKQLKEMTDGTIICKWTDAENKIKQLEDELTGRKKLCDLRYNQLKQARQEKIEFAVEQLENVKIRIQEDFDYDDLMYWLNKQIKQLKEME